MKEYQLKTKTVRTAPIEKVFAFFIQAGNLRKLTPPWLNFKIKTALPLKMK